MGSRTRPPEDARRTQADAPPTVQLLRNLQDLRGLESAWIRLGSRFPTPLLQHDWFLSCAEALHHEQDLRVIAIRRGGRVTAIAPLTLVHSSTATWLEILGSSRLHEPTGVLYEDAESLDDLVGAMIDQQYPILLRRIRTDSPTASAFRRRQGRFAFVIIRDTAPSCFIDLEREWARFSASLSAKSRAAFRCKQRKAVRLGHARLETHRPTLEQLPEFLEQAFAVEAASWKYRHGTALLQNEPLRSFFQRYAERAVRSGTFRVFFYRIGQNTVAMRLAVEFGGCLWFLKTGYNEQWAHLSPGMQLTMEVLRWSTGSGLDSCEFLGSDERWQHAWPVRQHRYSTILAYPASRRGLLGVLDTAITTLHGRIGRRHGSASRRAATAERAGTQ